MNDLIYFVEDDYIHSLSDSIKEMLLTYERLSSQLKEEIISMPNRLPLSYIISWKISKIFLGNKYHWRQIE